MSRRNPFEDVEALFDRMNRELEELGRQMEGGGRTAGRPGADVVETDDSLVVTLDLPGFELDDITVTVDDRELVVSADREESDSSAADEPGARYHRRERSRRGTSRRLRLPVDVRGEAASAEYERGVLTVTLPKERAGGGGGTRIDVE